MKNSAGQEWDFGTPATHPKPGVPAATAEFAGDVRYTAAAQSGLDLADPGANLIVTARLVDGTTWQDVVYSPTSAAGKVVKDSGWYPVVDPDLDFPVVPSQLPLNGNEQVQGWDVAPSTPSPSDLSRTQLLFVKTNQRVLAVPLNPGDWTRDIVSWRSVSPGGAFPSSSDGAGVAAFMVGQSHYLIANDAAGTPVMILINDGEVGACVRAADNPSCPVDRADAPFALTGEARSSSAGRYGDVTHLVAPPTFTSDNANLRVILDGESKSGYEVQNVFTSGEGWSGWYAADVNPDSPVIGGYIDSAGRVVSSSERYTYGSQNVYSVDTVWTRLDTLATGRRALEIHRGGVDRDGNLEPTSAFGVTLPANSALIDTPTPVLNTDESITLFAPVSGNQQSAAGIAVAHFDPITGHLTPWRSIRTCRSGRSTTRSSSARSRLVARARQTRVRPRVPATTRSGIATVRRTRSGSPASP